MASSGFPAPSSDAGLEALLLLAEGLLSAADSHTAAAVLLESVVSLYGAPRAVLLAAPDGRLPILATHGVCTSTSPVGPCRSDAVSRAVDEGTTALLSRLDPATEPWLGKLLPAGVDLLVVPLHADSRRYGALLLQLPELGPGQQRDPGWRSALVGPPERVASCAARALRNLWRMEQLERLAATDDLTMIANRRAFTAALERELARGARSGEPVSLVILDLDKFKSVNDDYGHPAGDEALRNVAAALSIACRDLDTAARYGGEEFAVILPDCGPDRCVDIADRLREAVASAPAVRPLTASAGVASYPSQASDVDSLVRAADNALLVSKRTGRNRTTRATNEPIEDVRREALARRVTVQGGVTVPGGPTEGGSADQH